MDCPKCGFSPEYCYDSETKDRRKLCPACGHKFKVSTVRRIEEADALGAAHHLNETQRLILKFVCQKYCKEKVCVTFRQIYEEVSRHITLSESYVQRTLLYLKRHRLINRHKDKVLEKFVYYTRNNRVFRESRQRIHNIVVSAEIVKHDLNFVGDSQTQMKNWPYPKKTLSLKEFNVQLNWHCVNLHYKKQIFCFPQSIEKELEETRILAEKTLYSLEQITHYKFGACRYDYPVHIASFNLKKYWTDYSLGREECERLYSIKRDPGTSGL